MAQYTNKPTTLYEKIWNSHVVREGAGDAPSILYVDFQLLQEVSSPQAFQMLRERGLKAHRPHKNIGIIDHSTPTLPPGPDGARAYVSRQAQAQVEKFLDNCREFGITAHGWESPDRGIVHVSGPELGITQPGRIIVCGDSHTSTHGAFGALAFGIGTTEVGHVLATQCLYQRKSKTFSISINGSLSDGVTAKDVALYILSQTGVDGGTGTVIEYRGKAIEDLSMEGRMTVCNMSIEAGARAGLVAPDEKTLAWLKGRDYAPEGSDWQRQLDYWRTLKTDDGAAFDKYVSFDASAIAPMVTFGTRPCDGIAIDEETPQPRNAAERAALDYMQIDAGRPMLGKRVKTVFIGSCTNSRLSDLRAAATIMRFGVVPEGVRALVVPGSNRVKREAEAEGLDKIFTAAGAEWREPGCSMCVAMNGDVASKDGLTMSTSNRNFVGRQGPGARTILCSPATAAASAIAGAVADPRRVVKI